MARARMIEKFSNVKIPRRSTEFSAGYDLYSKNEVTIPAGKERHLQVPVGVDFDVDVHKVFLFLRSSMGIKKHLRLVEEEIVPFIELTKNHALAVIIRNVGEEDFTIKKDMHFAQFIVMDKEESYRNFLVQYVQDLQGTTPISLSVEPTRKGAHWVLQEPLVLQEGESILVPTGYKVKIDQDSFLAGFIPKGEKRFAFANGVMIGDSDYYDNPDNFGHYFLKIDNVTNDTLLLEIGTPIVEIISIPYYTVEDEILPTKKRIGGIGSTTKEPF